MGKELLLRQGEAEPGKGGAFRLGKTYLGSSEAVYIALLQDNLYALLFLLLSLLLTGLYLLNAIFRLLPDIFVLLPCHILMVCDLLTLLQGGLKHLGSKQVKSVIVGILLLTAFAVGALLRFYRNSLANYAYLYCIGTVLFAICLVNAAFLRLFEQLEENANTAAYKRLAYTDILTGLENRAAYTEALQTQGEQRALSCVVLDLNHQK